MTKFKVIITLHKLIKKLNLDILLLVAYPVGFLYYIFTPFNSYILSKRKLHISNYSVLKVKINYVKYWIETIWLSKEGYMNQIYENVEIVNEEEITKLNKNYDSFIIALPHLGNWEFAIPMGKRLDLNSLSTISKKNEKNFKYLFLVSLEDIDPGQELVAQYTFYQF